METQSLPQGSSRDFSGAIDASSEVGSTMRPDPLAEMQAEYGLGDGGILALYGEYQKRHVEEHLSMIWHIREARYHVMAQLTT